MGLIALAFMATTMAVGPVKGVALTLLVGVIAYSVNAPSERTFKVVYINPTNRDAVEEKVVDGCIIKEMNANTKTLQAHLTEKELEPTICPLFLELGKEWMIHTRVNAARGSDEQHKLENAPDAT